MPAADSSPVADSLAGALRNNYDFFGQPEKEKELEHEKAPTLKVREFKGLKEGQMQKLYLNSVDSMNAKAQSFDPSQQAVSDVVKDTKTVSENGRAGIENIIEKLNAKVYTISPMNNGDNINVQFVTLLDQGYAALIDAVGGGIDGTKANSQKIQDLTDKLLAKEKKSAAATRKALAEAIDTKLAGLGDPSDPSDPSDPGSNPFGTDPNLDDLGDTPVDPETGLPVTDAGDDTTNNSGLDDAVQRALDSVESMPTTPVSPTPSASSPAAGMGGMGGMMGRLMNGMMLPMMMRNGMGANGLNDSLGARNAELASRRLERPRPITAPVQQATQSTPWSNQHTATPAGNATPGPQDGANSSQNGHGVAPQVPGPDGKVPYTFPDGRPQRVWPIVKQALDSAFGNTEGTDAQAAYAQTPAKWSDKKHIGAHIGPNQLITGDVATWEDRCAILAAFGPGDPGSGSDVNANADAGSLEVIVDGELKQFAPEMSDAAGDFGGFAGFAHPAGIEAGAGKNTDKTQGVPAPDDPSGAGMPAPAGVQSI